MRLLPLLALLSGCVLHVSGLEPRPNLPGVTSPPSVCVKLDDRILQKTQVGNVQLDTFRGDLKRGFLNGFPGAVKGEKGETQIQLKRAEPTYECVAYVGCFAALKYKGSYSGNGEEAITFAGTSRSDLCNDLNVCFQSAIERMYEQLFSAVKTRLKPSTPKSERPTSET